MQLKNGMGRALRAMMALALVTGIVWAAETQTVTTPGGNGFVVVAVITPGGGGADVLGPGEIEDDFEFSVRFDPTGSTVSINDGPGVTCDLNATYTVKFACYKVAGTWLVDTTVRCSSGALVASGTGHVMADAPATATATADAVFSLTAQ